MSATPEERAANLCADYDFFGVGVLKQDVTEAIRAAVAAEFERAAEWCDAQEERADKETGSYDEYHPGLSNAYAATADWLRAEAARARNGGEA